jgi:hypothetical protein
MIRVQTVKQATFKPSFGDGWDDLNVTKTGASRGKGLPTNDYYVQEWAIPKAKKSIGLIIKNKAKVQNIPILGFMTRPHKDGTSIDYAALGNKITLFNFETRKAKVRRIVGWLKAFEKKQPGSSFAVFGIKPERLDNITKLSQIPKRTASLANTFSKPLSFREALLGYCLHLRGF